MKGEEPGSHEERAVGLCYRCRFTRRVVSAKGSVFRQCAQPREHGGMLAYPPLPVLRCSAYEPDGADPGSTASD